MQVSDSARLSPGKRRGSIRLECSYRAQMCRLHNFEERVRCASTGLSGDTRCAQNDEKKRSCVRATSSGFQSRDRTLESRTQSRGRPQRRGTWAVASKIPNNFGSVRKRRRGGFSASPVDIRSPTYVDLSATISLAALLAYAVYPRSFVGHLNDGSFAAGYGESFRTRAINNNAAPINVKATAGIAKIINSAATAKLSTPGVRACSAYEDNSSATYSRAAIPINAHPAGRRRLFRLRRATVRKPTPATSLLHSQSRALGLKFQRFFRAVALAISVRLATTKTRRHENQAR
jgi:hypothetical protein